LVACLISWSANSPKPLTLLCFIVSDSGKGLYTIIPFDNHFAVMNRFQYIFLPIFFFMPTNIFYSISFSKQQLVLIDKGAGLNLHFTIVRSTNLLFINTHKIYQRLKTKQHAQTTTTVFHQCLFINIIFYTPFFCPFPWLKIDFVLLLLHPRTKLDVLRLV